MTGYIHVYTGNGKGKTTAAVGLAIRAAGAGWRVLFAQFIKGTKYSEIVALKRFQDLITISQYGRGCFIDHNPQREDIDRAVAGLSEVKRLLQEKKFDLVILDEATVAIHLGLFSLQDLIDAISFRDPSCEIVITGRYAPERLIQIADLVTEMKEVKHYYAQGVAARKGIER